MKSFFFSLILTLKGKPNLPRIFHEKSGPAKEAKFGRKRDDMKKQRTKIDLKPWVDDFLVQFITDRGGVMSVFHGTTIVG